MALKSDRARTAFLSVCAILVSSAMLFFGTGLHPIWWLTWFAALPVLLVAPRIGALQAFGAAALAWFAGSLNMWRYLRLFLPAVPLLVTLVVLASIFGLIVLAHRRFTRRGAPWRATLIVPVCWVAYEYTTSLLSPHSTFGNLAYTQMDCLPIVQLASVTGIWGISFCLTLFPAAAATLLSRSAGSRRMKPALAAGAFLIAVFSYGFWRLNSTPRDAPRITVGLMASDLPANLFPQTDAATLNLLRAYAGELRSLGGNSIIVLPEKIGVISHAGIADVDAIFQSVADRTATDVLVGLDAGLDHGAATRRSNDARYYSFQGPPGLVYHKHHLIPGFEDVDRPGPSLTLVNQPSSLWGIEICKDMDFPALSRQYGQQGIVLLLVPAWDFVVDGWLHDRMAVLRGVESGFPIVRAAKQGLLTVSDDRGRVLAQQSSAAAPFSFLTASVPLWHDRTLYTRWGDWFPWLNVAAMIAMLASRIR